MSTITESIQHYIERPSHCNQKTTITKEQGESEGGGERRREGKKKENGKNK